MVARLFLILKITKMLNFKKKYRTVTHVASLLCLCCFLVACPDHDKVEDLLKDDFVTILKKNKWILHEAEFNAYSNTELEYRTDAHYLHFLSDTEGWEVTITKIIDTFGSGNNILDRDISPFTYNVAGNKVYLHYSGSGSLTLTYSNGVLYDGDDIYEPLALNSSDYEFIRNNSPQTSVTGQCTYTYNPQTYELTISGNGAMADYAVGAQPWKDYVISDIVVEEGVTIIGANAFNNVGCSNVNYISLPNTLREIKAQAFADLPLLTDVIIPENVEIIGEAAFAKCKKLSRLQFWGIWADNPRLKSIGILAFSGCAIQNGIHLPNSVETIGNAAFSGSYNSVTLGNRVKVIENGAFNSTASSGKMYINRGNPPSAYNTLTRDDSKWTLYVPSGCKSEYQSTSPWKGFKSIVEDSSLEKGEDYVENQTGDNQADDNKEKPNDPEKLLYSGDIRGHKYVDLGLSVKWAYCNVGASKPEEYGWFLGWGELSQTVHDWYHYKFDNGGLSTLHFTKYINEYGKNPYGNPDYKTVLEKEDDVASVKWGSSWRMPTKSDFEELRKNCNIKWMSINGVYGSKFTSEINGNSIFFPAAGYKRDDKSLETNEEHEDEQEYGYYWTSTLGPGDPRIAYYFRFSSSWLMNGEVVSYSSIERCDGLPVRPVSD